MARLELDRSRILSYRRDAAHLHGRMPLGVASLERAAWAGLQDSMPRAAVLSIHARVEGVESGVLDDPALIQVWGPRFNVFAVATVDVAIFTLGRHSYDASRRDRAESMASRVHEFLAGRRMSCTDVGRAVGVHPNAIRYATTTGTVAINWDGARQPEIWTISRPEISVEDARKELARRYLHVFGPCSPASFAAWAGIRGGEAVFDSLLDELAPVVTPTGDAWILKSDEPAFRREPRTAVGARLLPSGDTYTLLWGPDRDLLVPDQRQQALLWTSRVWPGAVLMSDEIVGTWRRSREKVSVETWRKLTMNERNHIEEEAGSFPLPDLTRPIRVSFS